MLNITISRFVFEASLSSLYVALPGVGEVFASRDFGMTVNRWRENATA